MIINFYSVLKSAFSLTASLCCSNTKNVSNRPGKTVEEERPLLSVTPSEIQAEIHTVEARLPQVVFWHMYPYCHTHKITKGHKEQCKWKGWRGDWCVCGGGTHVTPGAAMFVCKPALRQTEKTAAARFRFGGRPLRNKVGCDGAAHPGSFSGFYVYMCSICT